MSEDDVVAALVAEREALGRVLACLRPPDWRRSTPSPGWDVTDQVGHLAWFDHAAARALARPREFDGEVHRHDADPEAYAAAALREPREADATQVLARWQASGRALRSAIAATRPDQRVNWFGHRMAVRSLVTARLMETWAHGLDVVEACGVARAETDRLRHIAHLGCRSIAFAFAVHGLDPPARPFRVELTLPSGAAFVHGPEDARERVRGTALDFCLLVTQRRLHDDLDLVVEGALAGTWASIAQAFAGPPGMGRTAMAVPEAAREAR